MKTISNNKKTQLPEFSPEALREFTESRRIANEAVRKANEENKKLGLDDKPAKQ